MATTELPVDVQADIIILNESLRHNMQTWRVGLVAIQDQLEAFASNTNHENGPGWY